MKIIMDLPEGLEPGDSADLRAAVSAWARKRIATRNAVHRAKARLKELGWSYRRVAPLLGVRFEHLCLVLNGHRDSLRLLAAIEDLPPAPLEGRQDVA